jgi:IclR family pca regulon transcriptional regulator
MKQCKMFGMRTFDASPPTPVNEREYVMGLEKGLSVIEAFSQVRGPATLSQLAEVTGHTRASVRRSLLTLCQLGYAWQSGRHFMLAPRTLRLGHAFFQSEELSRRVQPMLELLSERTRESASLAVLDSREVVFIARATHRRSLSAGFSVGTRLPVFCSATGRVLLAQQPRTQVEHLLRNMARPALTAYTATEVPHIMRLIDKARTQKYAISDQEIELGLRSIAVPIGLGDGPVQGAISLSVARLRKSSDELIEGLLPHLRDIGKMLNEAC